jgi:hypothetical protein
MTTKTSPASQVDVNVRGVCGTCKHRDATGYCLNDKLDEDFGQSDVKKADMLIYEYSEGGRFWVGERFGCVHHTTNAPSSADAKRSAGMKG